MAVTSDFGSRRKVCIGSFRPLIQFRAGLTNNLSPIQQEAFTAIRLAYFLTEERELYKLREFCRGLAVNDAIKLIHES